MGVGNPRAYELAPLRAPTRSRPAGRRGLGVLSQLTHNDHWKAGQHSAQMKSAHTGGPQTKQNLLDVKLTRIGLGLLHRSVCHPQFYSSSQHRTARGSTKQSCMPCRPTLSACTQTLYHQPSTLVLCSSHAASSAFAVLY